MATTYPTTKQSIPNPSSTDLMENATPELDHDYQHSTVNDTIEALQDKVGMDGSAVTTSHDYKLGEVTGSDKAVGKTATQTLTNKTLTSPQVNFGSDATGDMIYRNGSGVTTRLPIGSTDQILTVAGGVPTWTANPAASDASTTVKGVVEIATTAEITAGTSTGGTGATLVIPASAVGSAGASKLVQFDSSGKYPAADGSAITNIVETGSKLLAQSSSTLTQSTADTNENTLLTVSIPANTLGTSNAVRVKLRGTVVEATGNTTNTIRFKYGSTTTSTVSMTNTNSSSTYNLMIEYVLYATGSTSSQKGAVMFISDKQTTSGATKTGHSVYSSGTASETSTSALNFVITTQLASTSNVPYITITDYVVERLSA